MNFYQYNGMGGNFSSDNSENKGRQNDGASVNGANYDDAMNAYVRFQGKSEQELMGELSSLVSKMKADGTFDVDSLERLYSATSAMLNAEQRERMRALIDMLKG